MSLLSDDDKLILMIKGEISQFPDLKRAINSALAEIDRLKEQIERLNIEIETLRRDQRP